MLVSRPERREDESVTAFTLRLMRWEIVQDCVRAIEASRRQFPERDLEYTQGYLAGHESAAEALRALCE